MYELFTDQAREVALQAAQEAKLLDHEYVGTEHILLALVKQEKSDAVRILKNLGIDPQKVPLETSKFVLRGSGEMLAMGRLPCTPRAKKVIEFAIEEALRFEPKCVDTRHLLLGLLREKEGVAAQLLMNLGLTLERVRANAFLLPGCETVKGKSTESKLFIFTRSDKPLEKSTVDTPVETPDYPIVGYDRFTDRARKVMRLANDEARRLHHKKLGTEHILLGLMAERVGFAAYVLSEVGFDLQRLRNEVERFRPSGVGEAMPDVELPLTLRAKVVIRYAMDEIRKLDHHYVGTEHLLLALLREREGSAAKVLVNLRIDLEDMRQGIHQLLGR